MMFAAGAGCTPVGAGIADVWNSWLSPSDRRLSPESPGNERWIWKRTSWLVLPFAPSGPATPGIGLLMNGTRTLLVQAERARASVRTGTLLRLSAMKLGVWRRSSEARPRSSLRDIRRRTWVMNGSAASSVGAEERAAGSASIENARSDGSELFSEASAGCASRSVSLSVGTDADS